MPRYGRQSIIIRWYRGFRPYQGRRPFFNIEREEEYQMMKRELASKYDPKEVEDRLYAKWEKNGYFHAEPDPSKKPFTIVMPPPNITGQLHMGHALDNTMQDILVRYKRMQGYNALWQPGTDHASIATEVKIIETLKKQGIRKEDLGREGFLKRAWEWKEEYGGRIISQLKKMGSSADWQRERFTMDEGCSEAVKDVFIRLYQKKLIYKGSRLINWCPVCQTSISDAEVEHVDMQGHFWHILYPVSGMEGTFLEVATTRPETMLGDTAVAVNPEDERYKHLVGKMVHLPLTDREIPIIADEHADMTKGTGVVKITPAHDPNDYEVGKRHNLPEINMLNDDGTIAAIGGKYAGMDRYEARKVMVEDLKALGLLGEVETITHSVGTHDRCKTVIEPMIKPQWFVAMKDLAKPAVEAVRSGQLKLIPERMEKVYYNWLDNIRDWCISRQLWWGHRIPAYYCQDCQEIVVAKEAPTVCPKCGGTHFKQDEDTLDTWFSSALWPFSTLGWPEETEDYKYFYPTDVLVTGYDIIFFWVIRMVFSGIEHTGKLPFHAVLFHGLVRDSQGRKMSKSLGNGIDPLEVIDQYGADALRLTLITGNAPGNDMRFYWERVEASRNFANKIWNASRFVLMNQKEELPEQMDPESLTAADRWILSKVNTLAKEATDLLDRYELGIAADMIQSFIWEEFCDWYIEMVKTRLYAEPCEDRTAAMWTLTTVLANALKLLHPYMPFLTEELYFYIRPEEETIMRAEWPVYREDWNFPAETEEVDAMKEAIRGIRNVRTQMNVSPKQKTTVIFVSDDEHTKEIFTSGAAFLAPLAFASEVRVQSGMKDVSDTAVSIPLHKATAFIPLEQLVDLDKERARLAKERERLDKEIDRLSKKLNNPGFVSKAPAAVVEEERKKQARYEAQRQQVEEQLARLG